MLFWADVVQQMPDSALLDIPPDVVACEWGYEDDHPFEECCTRLADAGVAFMVCPGTSSWNRSALQCAPSFNTRTESPW